MPKIFPKTKISDQNALKKALSGDDMQGIFHLAGLFLKLKPIDSPILFNFLNLARSSTLLQKIYKDNRENEWFDHCLKIIKKSNFTLAHLFHQRVQQYNSKTLFKKIEGNHLIEYSWNDIKQKVYAIARSLLALSKPDTCGPVAILSENNLEMACVDLACLITGIVNVPVAANSLAGSIVYVLNHSEAKTIFVSGEKQLTKILEVKERLKKLRDIVVIQALEKLSDSDGTLTFEAFLKKNKEISEADILAAMEKVKLSDLATIMYTSGTTETPKGIMFSHLNLISKRFARAMAIPEIGEQDTFLCYLPLYHTFGRYFEMMGCLFWGCTYTFMSGTGIETIIENMRLVKPTVFISIPQKWIQLYEKIQEAVDIHTAPHSEIQDTVAEMTGGKLRWGLSAAGYLDPEIFRFFQRYSVELMSGFGMTEATGGITMTPPFQYRPNSVGKALPGIDINLEDDGEMKIRGSYVMTGYLKEKSLEKKSGWFHTGDIFTIDSDGFYQIIDRKKEIYKNVKGQTISPQKIENLFNEFESIQNVFLIGDHREYNTLLLYPNYDYEQFDLKKLNLAKLREFFGSLIVTVNRFLAPFERIIDFEIINRDFAEAYGELTPKGTYKRKAIEENFKELLMNMYGAKYIKFEIAHHQLRIPKWFLREKGLTANDLKLNRNSLRLQPDDVSLNIKSFGTKRNQIQIGSFVYKTSSKDIDLTELVNNPALWVGNLELENFAGKHILQRTLFKKSHPSAIEVVAVPRRNKQDRQLLKKLESFNNSKTYDLQGAHVAAYLIYNSDVIHAKRAVDYLAAVIDQKSEQTSRIASMTLLQLANYRNKALRRYAFTQVLSVDKYHSTQELLNAFVLKDDSLLDKNTNNKISEKKLNDVQLRSIFSFLEELHDNLKGKNKSTVRKQFFSVLGMITSYGIKHPVSYKSIRAELVRWSLVSQDRQVRNQARICVKTLQEGFRKWLGPNQVIAVDPETGKEFRWQDVITCDEGLDSQDEEKIVTALKKFPLIREAIFLFSGKTLVRLEDIAHKGVWISFLGALHGKTVYRMSVQTRDFGSFDLVININKELSQKDISTEIAWLVCAGSQGASPPVVEDFGGYWSEFDLWTEEFIPGENVETLLRRLYRPSHQPSLDRIRNLWLHFIWSGLSTYVEFWNRTGRILEIADPTPTNVIVPLSDFQTGSRIVSISSRQAFRTITGMLTSFYENFVIKQEKKYPKLKVANRWHIIFSTVIESLGENQGLQILETVRADLKSQKSGQDKFKLSAQLIKFMARVKEEGYLSKRLYFAIRRFNRWLSLNPKATPQAQLQTLQDLDTTYTLDELEKNYCGSRIQLFRDTVFANNQEIKTGLNQIIRKLRLGLENIDLIELISQLKTQTPFTEQEEFFITRMTFPHLGPEENAALISAGEQGASEATLIVFIEDQEGNKLAVRQPASPKEIAKLHGLYTMANLPIEFRPEHQYLIVISNRGQVIGGLFYRFVEPQYVHLEKIVIDRRYRKKGVSSGLMQQFFNRLKSRNVEIITVGFLRPEFFYRFGFRIEHSYGNMVKWLSQESTLKNIHAITPS